MEAEGDSQWTFFDGNYQEYEADKKKRLGEEGAKPKRMRYKRVEVKASHLGGFAAFTREPPEGGFFARGRVWS